MQLDVLAVTYSPGQNGKYDTLPDLEIAYRIGAEDIRLAEGTVLLPRDVLLNKANTSAVQ